MIKALRTAGNGRAHILLGLTQEDIAHLCAGEPIVVETAPFPPDGLGVPGGPVISIIAGGTEDEILTALTDAGVTIGELFDQRDGPSHG